MQSNILPFAFLILISACSRSAPEQFSTYDINFQETINHDGELAIKFDTIVSDSRCPTKVECIWSGEVTVELEAMFQKDMLFNFQLSDHPNFPELIDTTIGGYYFKLLEVNPYPQEPGELEAEDYWIRLLIEDEG